MVELASWQDRFAAEGVAVAALSYDGREVLAEFHAERELGYPLLSDVDAAHVKAYGVLNPQYEPGHRAYGIPLPGVLLIAPDGEILAKFAVSDYRERPPLEDIQRGVAEALASRDDG